MSILLSLLSLPTTLNLTSHTPLHRNLTCQSTWGDREVALQFRAEKQGLQALVSLQLGCWQWSLTGHVQGRWQLGVRRQEGSEGVTEVSMMEPWRLKDEGRWGYGWDGGEGDDEDDEDILWNVASYKLLLETIQEEDEESEASVNHENSIELEGAEAERLDAELEQCLLKYASNLSQDDRDFLFNVVIREFSLDRLFNDIQKRELCALASFTSSIEAHLLLKVTRSVAPVRLLFERLVLPEGVVLKKGGMLDLAVEALSPLFGDLCREPLRKNELFCERQTRQIMDEKTEILSRFCSLIHFPRLRALIQNQRPEQNTFKTIESFFESPFFYHQLEEMSIQILPENNSPKVWNRVFEALLSERHFAGKTHLLIFMESELSSTAGIRKILKDFYEKINQRSILLIHELF